MLEVAIQITFRVSMTRLFPSKEHFPARIASTAVLVKVLGAYHVPREPVKTTAHWCLRSSQRPKQFSEPRIYLQRKEGVHNTHIQDYHTLFALIRDQELEQGTLGILSIMRYCKCEKSRSDGVENFTTESTTHHLLCAGAAAHRIRVPELRR